MAQSSIQFRISEADLNEVVKGLKFSGQETREGKLPPWSITIDWSVENFRFEIGHEKVFLIVEACTEGKIFRYTDDVKVEVFPQFKESTLLLDVSSARANLYFRTPISETRVDLAEIDVAKFLGGQFISINIPESFTTEVPRVGEKQFFLSNKTLEIEQGFITVAGQFSITSPD